MKWLVLPLLIVSVLINPPIHVQGCTAGPDNDRMFYRIEAHDLNNTQTDSKNSDFESTSCGPIPSTIQNTNDSFWFSFTESQLTKVTVTEEGKFSLHEKIASPASEYSWQHTGKYVFAQDGYMIVGKIVESAIQVTIMDLFENQGKELSLPLIDFFGNASVSDETMSNLNSFSEDVIPTIVYDSDNEVVTIGLRYDNYTDGVPPIETVGFSSYNMGNDSYEFVSHGYGIYMGFVRDIELGIYVLITQDYEYLVQNVTVMDSHFKVINRLYIEQSTPHFSFSNGRIFYASDSLTALDPITGNKTNFDTFVNWYGFTIVNDYLVKTNLFHDPSFLEERSGIIFGLVIAIGLILVYARKKN